MTQDSLTKQDIENKVRAIVADQLDKDESEVTSLSTFTEDLGADSLDLVELIMAIEEEFGCEVPDNEAAKIKTIYDAVAYIEEKKVKKENASPES